MKLLIRLILCINLVGCSVSNNQQLLMLNTVNNHSTIQRYVYQQRSWHAIGDVIPVVIGKNGLTKDKKEGDLCTPQGRFSLGSAFGTTDEMKINWSYIKLSKAMICVDHQESMYYNQWINQTIIPKSTWISGEQLFYVQPQYSLGLIINYNITNPKPGAGSCIFMHVWQSPHTGTAGCVAMSKPDLYKILKWLDPKLHPYILIR